MESLRDERICDAEGRNAFSSRNKGKPFIGLGGGNGKLGFQLKKALANIPFIVGFSSFMDETSFLSDLILPQPVSMEAWQGGVSRLLDGTTFFHCAPPALAPLYDVKDAADFVIELARAQGGELAAAFPWNSFPGFLQGIAKDVGAIKSLKKGGWSKISAPARAPLRPTLASFKPAEISKRGEKENSASSPRLCVEFPLCFSRGKGAHLPYLQSLAGPQLGEQWETWAAIHPQTASRLGIKDRQMVWIESSAGRIFVRARIYEKMAREVVAVPFGLGHSQMGRWAAGIGANPAEIVLVGKNSGKARWQGESVNVHG